MIEIVVAAGLATTATAAGTAALWWPTRDRLVKRRLRDRVVITLKSGASFGGVLFEADSRSFVLRNAAALGAAEDGDHITIDGELIVPRGEVEFVQRP